MTAMIILKQTPRGIKLLPVAELRGDRALLMQNSHPDAHRVKQMMDLLIIEARKHVGRRVTLPELWEGVTKQFGPTFFTDVVLLPTVRDTPPRLLFK